MNPIEVKERAATMSGRNHNLSAARSTKAPRTIWIDLDNSPHVPFFAPIITELKKRGHNVFVTARDFAQVTKLADLHQVQCKTIGHHYGKHTLLKLAGVVIRASQLASVVRRAAPDLAISHGSRSQLLLSAVLRVPSVLIDDYEHSVYKGIHPRWLIAPELIPRSSWHMPADCVFSYPGIKEDVYVPKFVPEPALLSRLGVSERNILVTVRPPASHAHYHSPESDRLFAAVIERLVEESNVVTVLLPRTPDQEQNIRKQWGRYFERGNMIVPPDAVDGLNLIWLSDLVISGGGTMNREAAALHVPVYSTFRGAIGAIDHYLQRQERLALIESIEDVRTRIRLIKRVRDTDSHGNTATLNAIVDHIDTILERQCRQA